MLVCTRPLICSDRWHGEVRFRPGVSFVADSSPYAERYPQHFAPAADRCSRARSRSLIRYTPPGATATQTEGELVHPQQLRPARADWGREPWRLGFQTAECRWTSGMSSTPVRLSRAVRRQILEVLATTTDHDRREVGGLLLGGGDEQLIEVLEAHGPGPDCVREADRFRADAQHDLALVRHAVDRGLRELGRWHCHPGGFRGPSPGDLRAFANVRALIGRQSVELIAVPDADGWRFESFVVSATYSGVDACQRAHLQWP